MERIIQCDKIFDGEKFIQENTIVIYENKIADLFYSDDNDNTIEYYEGVLVPGFVNAHCHLELSYLHNQFELGKGLLGFIKQMFEKRNLFSEEEIITQAEYWDKKMQENGIVVVGDIVNTLHTLNIKINSPIHYVNFIEVFGLLSDKAESIFQKAKEIKDVFLSHHLPAYLVAHAPYSLSHPLWQKILTAYKNDKNSFISSMHFMESSDEINFLKDQNSVMRNFFEQEINLNHKELLHLINNFEDCFQQLIENAKSIILVHNTFWKGEFERIFNNFKDKIFFCLCPNANLFIEQQLPAIDFITFYTENICIGTDSLASNFNLSVVDEMNVLLSNFPKLPVESVLKWATINGAKALNIDQNIGSIKKNSHLPLNIIKIKDRKIIHKGMIK